MAVLTAAQFLAITDKLAAARDLCKGTAGIASGSPVAGTMRNLLANLETYVAGLADIPEITDLGPSVQTAAAATNVAGFIATKYQPILSALDDHFRNNGSLTDASIAGVLTFLAYYNGGSGGLKYANMVSAGFGDLWFDVKNAYLPASQLIQPAIHPDFGALATHGMGERAVGGAFTAGTAYNALYGEVKLNAEVTADFSSGSAPPTLTIAGTDDSGGTGTTWTATLSGNNPTSALSTTITPAVTAQARQTVALGATTGIVVGSVIGVNVGAPDQEYVVVETVGGGNIAAVFQKAHTAGAAVTAVLTVALTPSVGTARCRSVSNITIGISSHSTGTVRISGVQDRVAAP